MFGVSCSKKYRTMPTSSMEPTIKTGEVVCVDFSAYRSIAPKRWEVVLFEAPFKDGGEWAKRVVGLPGETVDFQKGKMMINGLPMPIPTRLSLLPYTPPISDRSLKSVTGVSEIAYPYLIGANQYFVIGDNVENSLDSRYFGAVEGAKILGRVIDK